MFFTYFVPVYPAALLLRKCYITSKVLLSTLKRVKPKKQLKTGTNNFILRSFINMKVKKYEAYRTDVIRFTWSTLYIREYLLYMIISPVLDVLNSNEKYKN